MVLIKKTIVSVVAVGFLFGSVACEPTSGGGTPVISTTAKPKHKKKKSRKKGTPAVEYHCFTNAGKKTCTPKAQAK